MFQTIFPDYFSGLFSSHYFSGYDIQRFENQAREEYHAPALMTQLINSVYRAISDIHKSLIFQ